MPNLIAPLKGVTHNDSNLYNDFFYSLINSYLESANVKYIVIMNLMEWDTEVGTRPYVFHNQYVYNWWRHEWINEVQPIRCQTEYNHKEHMQ